MNAQKTITIARSYREGVGWFRSTHYRNKKAIKRRDEKFIERRETIVERREERARKKTSERETSMSIDVEEEPSRDWGKSRKTSSAPLE